MKDIYGLPTSKKAVAQDYWLQQMTPLDRLEIMSKVARHIEMGRKLDACLDYVTEHLLEFTQGEDGVLTARPKATDATLSCAS